MPRPPLLALLLALTVDGSRAFAQTDYAQTPVPERKIVQIRILGLHRVPEGGVRARLRAREWAAYSEQDRALDVAALLSTGEFSSVKVSEVALSSTAARLDIEVVEASPAAVISTGTLTVPEVIHSTTLAPPPTPVAVSTAPPQPAPPRRREGDGLQPPWVVGDIAVSGNRNVKLGVIRSQLKARKGDLYQKGDLERDIQSLMGMGNFERVAVDISSMPERPVPQHLLDQAGSATSIRLTFLVEERPIIKKIRYSGNKKLSRGRLSDKTAVKEKDPLDRLKVREDSDNLLKLYIEKGYLGATVEPKIDVDTAAANAEVTFLIAEGPRTVISEVRLEGVKAFKPKKVRKQMENRRKKVLQEAKLEEDLKKIEALYKNNGYLDFKVASHTVSFSADKTTAAITLSIEEGRRYRYGQTTFSGNTVYVSSHLARAIEYKRGKIFNQEKFDLTLRGIQELYADKGYLRARVTPDKTYNEAAGEMDVNLDIVEANIHTIDHIDIEGNRTTKTYVFTRELVIKPGQVFSSSKLRKSIEKIMNLGFVEDVNPDFQSPTDPDKVDITLEIAEGKPGLLTAGAGFSSLDGVIGSLSLQHMNLFGRAQRAAVQWQFGARVQDYSVSWTTPWVRNRPVSLGFDVFNTRRISPFETSSSAYINKRTGGSIRVGPRFQDDKYQLSFTYTFQSISITNVQSQFLGRLTEGTSINSSVVVELARDTRDSFWDPSRGTRNSVGVGLAGGPFGGDIHFLKPFVSSSGHLTLTRWNEWPLVLSILNRAGYVTQFGETREVPVFDRFFVGGQDSLRGYSPNGEVGWPSGGKLYDVFTTEIGFPLARERKRTIVKLVGFFDAGTAWDNMRSVRMRVGSQEHDVKMDVGFGVRFVTPAFPIRLDYGYGLNHRPGERLYQINFGIGPMF